jgi:hypothetical protein
MSGLAYTAGAPWSFEDYNDTPAILSQEIENPFK